MTANEFAAMCGEYLLEPAEVLENPNAVAAIKANDRQELDRVLRDEFEAG